MALFGLLGYVFRKLDAEPAPLLLAFILGPMMEEFLRRAMLISKGDPLVFGDPPDQRRDAADGRDALLILVISPAISKKREEAFHEET